MTGVYEPTIDPIISFNDQRYVSQARIIGIRWGIVRMTADKDPLRQDSIRVWMPPWPEDKMSEWIQPIFQGQGYKCGLFLPPHEGDEVMLIYYDGDPNKGFYLTHSSLAHPVPDEHTNGKPEDRWMMRTLRGHLLELFDDPQEQQILIQSIEGAYLIIDDVQGRRKLKVCDQEGRYICLDPESRKIEWKDLAGNKIVTRDGDVKDIQIVHGQSESFIWLKQNGDVHINAQEELNLTAKTIRHWASQKTIDHVPETTVTCIEDGKDYVTCGAVRTSECYDCENETGTGETPPSSDPSAQYEFKQTNPSNEWTVNHGKNKYPQITVIDNNGFVLPTTLRHITKNQAKIYFNEPRTGTAIFD
jgi:hypothetical protein